ncbi:hypothetical protein TNCV_1119971 [Trichonephila clavipes]|uniref:Uncharacterized protein n=1 Tax=Trichonephila clavipes TaxID=2585209 RepID=A0A8X6T7Q6_TRICX|nr:hypothetical protein TNCV_1119971 [Trichonephila clavipes]
MDITLRKSSKIITLFEYASITVRDTAAVVGVGNSSVSRILRTFQDSGTSPKRKGKNGCELGTVRRSEVEILLPDLTQQTVKRPSTTAWLLVTSLIILNWGQVMRMALVCELAPHSLNFNTTPT